MPAWLRTVLLPPSQPITQDARTVRGAWPSACNVSVAPSASCTSAVIAVPSATVTRGSYATRARSRRSTGGWVNTSDGV